MWFSGKSDESGSTPQNGEILRKEQGIPKKEENVQDILNTVDFEPEKLHPLAGLNKDIEYLDLDDEKLSTMEGSGNPILATRGWGDDLCYGAGTVYVLGLGFGGLRGFDEGLKSLPQPKVDPLTNKLRPVPFKLKLNTILNQVTKFGPHAGNTAGVLGIMYNIINSSFDHYRGKHDDWNSLASGFLSGALYKSTSGLKAMGISSMLMTGVAASWCGLKRFVAHKQATSRFEN
ncbi:hypothetical protein BRETT_003014 [Brettanomyces bruxellensis]|uniref:Mitochondrial import inner membrane translocase subunit TIM23 n=1 Tax=Dekkera bruxellensis TaxID=5007 RepID=A0A871RGH2_DEKBR|nr:uncharacterized protein BRETT_003014 [Brettanomyces bruxellensis]QOU22828.1 hypothetical protein BRETT_003014 [Brettanomyces bruxellensis]